MNSTSRYESSAACELATAGTVLRLSRHVDSLVLLAAIAACSTMAVAQEGSAQVEGAPVATAKIAGGPTAARAEEAAPLFPLPFTPDFTRGGGWGFALGVGIEYENAYSGSDEYEFGVDPAIAIQWRTGDHLFSWEGLELSYTTRQADRWYFQVDLGLDGEREAGDSDDGRLDGLEERDDEFAGTGEVRYAFDGEWRNYVGMRVSAGDSDFGALGFVFAGHRFGDRQDGGGMELFLYSTFADGNNLNREFGVSPSEAAASGYAETDLDGGYRSSGLRLVDRRIVAKHVQIVSGLELQYFGNDVQDSPIAREDFAVEVELAVIFHF